MPVYNLTYTATMPGSKGVPERFRTRITAANPAEAQVKLHRFVQEKIQTGITSCEEEKSQPSTTELPEVIKDLLEAADIMARSSRLQKKYGFGKEPTKPAST